MPFIFTTGVPITEKWSGVIGVSNGRFLHHPLPIVGFNWVASPNVHLGRLSEPALVVDVKKISKRASRANCSARDSKPIPTRRFPTRQLFFVSDRSHAQVHARASGAAITGGGGYEVGRTFDAYRDSHRWTTGGAPYVQLGVDF